MEDKTLKEAWAWLDEDFRLDFESPLAISQSLWDDFAQNEAVVRSLFPSTPGSHAKDSVPPDFSFGKPDSPEPSSSWDIMPDCSPSSLKRRRMLHFSGDDPIDKSLCFSGPLENCSDSLMEVCEDLQANGPSSSSSMWHMANEESLSSVDDAVEQSAESWMVGCFSDSDTSDVQELPQHRVNPPVIAAASKASLARATGTVLKSRQTPKFGLPKAACPSLQLNSERCTDVPGKVQFKRSAQGKASQSRHVKESPNPVLAYPFALVKPSGIQGDITLQDINQRINMAPPTAKTGSKQSKKATTSPCSGKSVLALTKIYTEGKGTITIMRTRS